jgi:hypothetical protein
MRHRAVSLSLPIVCCLVARPAWAQDELPLTATETLTVEYHIDNQNDQDDDDDYGIIVNRLNLSGTDGNITAALRIDSTWFAFPDRDPVEEFVDDVARLERFSAQYRLGDWTLDAGDFYAQLGRGITFAIRKLPEVGLDVAIRGGHLEYASEDHEVSLFAGTTNPANLDSVAQRFVEDTEDIVAGVAWEVGSLDGADIGAYALYLEPTERLLPEERDFTHGAGLYVELNRLTDWLSLYAEVDEQHRELAGSGTEGYAGYLTADLVFGDLLILLEGLMLDEFEVKGSRSSATGARFDYNQAPTLERIDQEVIQNRYTNGGRLRIEYYVFDWDVLIYANGMLRMNDPGEAAEVRQFHGYAGTEIYFGGGLGHLYLSSGFRDETQTQLDPPSQIKSMFHQEIDFLHPIGDGLSLHLTWFNELRTLAEAEYERGDAIAGVDISGVGGLSVNFGYDNQNSSGDTATTFIAGILALELSDDISVSLTGGTQRGGIKCINGVCRVYPEFAGGQAILVGRF